MTKAKQKPIRNETSSKKAETRAKPGSLKPKVRDETDLGSDLQGKNSLQGEDQTSRHNQRETMPDEQ